eukprot:10940766-Heterocapsa_arctica.AAC.1
MEADVLAARIRELEELLSANRAEEAAYFREMAAVAEELDRRREGLMLPEVSGATSDAVVVAQRGDEEQRGGDGLLCSPRAEQRGGDELPRSPL